MELKFGEIFSGAGGMSLGASMAKAGDMRIKHAWAVDMDPDACRTFARNIDIDPDMVLCRNAMEIEWNELPKIDALAFGFPCNDFSVIGDRKGLDGNYGGMYTAGVNALKAHHPIFFVAENVSGLSSNGNALKIIEKDLAAVGYNMSRHVFKFEKYGVPQARHRIIIAGFRKDVDMGFFGYRFPSPTTADNPVTCAEALDGVESCIHNNEVPVHPPEITERIRHIKPGQNIFTADMPDHLKMKMKSNATISQLWKKLDPDKPAYTVIAAGGGGTHMYHWKENRALTNRERARLQTFPDDFVFEGGRGSVRKQIGMAVPVLGAKIIFESILKALEDAEWQ